MLPNYILSFKEFQNDFKKNKDATVGQVFAKQIMQIPGISVVKGQIILNVFPTLNHLLTFLEKSRETGLSAKDALRKKFSNCVGFNPDVLVDLLLKERNYYEGI